MLSEISLGATMNVRYRVTLTPEERNYLEDITNRGKHSAQKFEHARALLLCDTSSDGKITRTVAAVAEAVGVTCRRTIEHLKKRFVEEGVESALTRKPAGKPPREICFDGAFEAKLIALACSDAPDGRNRWTMRLLADKAVELQITESISKTSVSDILTCISAINCKQIRHFRLRQDPYVRRSALRSDMPLRWRCRRR